MKIGFNVKISLLVGIVAFLVTFIVGKYSTSQTSIVLENKAGNHLIDVSKHIAEVLDREMLERYREMKLAASSNVLTSKDSPLEKRKEFIQSIKDNYDHHEWIGYALPDGTVEIGTNGYLEGKNAKARPWHPAGLKGPYIGDVHDALLLAKLLPNLSGEPIYFTDVAFPVVTKDNETLGVLCTHLTWQWTRNIIRQIQKDKGIDIFLVASDGLILVGPEDSERKNIKDLSQNVYKNFLSMKEKYSVVDWNKNAQYLTATYLSNGVDEYEGFSWRVIVRQNIDDAFNEIEDINNKIFMVSIASFIFGLLIGIVFANILNRPIKRLNSIVSDIKNKKNLKLEEIDSNDEIDRLHNAIVKLNNSLIDESKLRKNAEEKIDVSLKLFEQSTEGIIVTNDQNNIILINDAFTKITGFKNEDVIGKNPSILSSSTNDKEFYEKMWNDIIDNEKWEGKIINKKKDGSTYDEYLKITTLKNESGKILYYIATFRGLI